MGFNDIFYDAQTQSRAHLLGGKKGIPDLFQNLVINSLALVIKIYRNNMVIGTDRNVNGPSSRHCLHGIDKDIQKRLIEHISVGLDFRQEILIVLVDGIALFFDLHGKIGNILFNDLFNTTGN